MSTDFEPTDVPSSGVLGRARSMLRTLGRRVHPDGVDGEMTEAVDSIIPAGPTFDRYLINFVVLTVLSASIAALGLLADSGAVVIGAMLVAPLMAPITATSVALVRAHNVDLVRSLGLIALGTVLAIATGAIVAMLTASDIAASAELPHEISTRTFPRLIDLGVAIAAGTAAGFIAPRPSINSALPGVGISVALVPPLAVVGITAQAGLSSEWRNALLLFLTNLAAIVFAAAVLLLLAGIRPGEEADRPKIGRRLLITMACVLVVAVPLALHTRQTIRDRNVNRDVLSAISAWDDDARVVDLDITIGRDRADIVIDVVGPTPEPAAWELAALIRERTGYDVELELSYERTERFQVSAR